jgi:hypothetical protein
MTFIYFATEFGKTAPKFMNRAIFLAHTVLPEPNKIEGRIRYGENG